jgi:hypothetical protein
MYNNESKHYPRHLYERLISLFHYQILYSISFFLVAQVIYLNFHYVIGSIISMISIFNITSQSIWSLIEYFSLRKGKLSRVDTLLHFHSIFNHIILLLYIPFMIWAFVLMINK